MPPPAWPLGVVGGCWMLLGVVGCCWMLLGIVGCCWMLLDGCSTCMVIGCCWSCWLIQLSLYPYESKMESWVLLPHLTCCWKSATVSSLPQPRSNLSPANLAPTSLQPCSNLATALHICDTFILLLPHLACCSSKACASWRMASIWRRAWNRRACTGVDTLR